MAYFAPRDAQTTLPCPKCGEALHVGRSCHEVFMRCPGCGQHFPVQDFIAKADQAMEDFLENVYCDRM